MYIKAENLRNTRGKALVDVLTRPTVVADIVRDRTGRACAWLDDPAEQKHFADALFVLLLADRSRGGARQAQNRALASVHPFESGWARAYVAARKPLVTGAP
jgi:hypothetical protein